MNKKIIAYATVAILVLAGIMFLGKSIQGNVAISESEPKGSASLLTVTEKSYDFGTISMKNGLVEHVFKVSNPSDKDVLVKKVATSCMCTAAYIEGGETKKGPFGMEGHGFLPPANILIKAGESKDVRVVFDPNAHGPAGVGRIDRAVMLSDGAGSGLQFSIRAVVTP